MSLTKFNIPQRTHVKCFVFDLQFYTIKVTHYYLLVYILVTRLFCQILCGCVTIKTTTTTSNIRDRRERKAYYYLCHDIECFLYISKWNFK